MRFVICLIIVLCCGLQARAEEPRRSITVDARSEVRVVPDEAVLDFVIHTRNVSVITATAENDQICVRLARAVKPLSLTAEEFRVTDFAIGPVYEGRPMRLAGYEVDRSFQIRTSDFAKIHAAVSVVVRTCGDAVRIHELTFRVRDQRKHQAEARRLAMKYARDKAEDLAALNKMALGQPSEISEGVESSDGSDGTFQGFGGGFSQIRQQVPQWKPVSQARGQADLVLSGAADELPPAEVTEDEKRLLLSPGQVSLNATVTVTFDLVPIRAER